MSSKPANMAAAGLLATKGAAVPPKDAPQRAATIHTPSRVEAKADDAGLVPLQFRVPPSFREAFEVYAFTSQPRRKMVDVLKAAFEALQEKEGRA